MALAPWGLSSRCGWSGEEPELIVDVRPRPPRAYRLDDGSPGMMYAVLDQGLGVESGRGGCEASETVEVGARKLAAARRTFGSQAARKSRSKISLSLLLIPLL